MNNAGGLGPSPLPRLLDLDVRELQDLFRVNTTAPLRLLQLAVPLLTEGGTVVNVTSAVVPFPRSVTLAIVRAGPVTKKSPAETSRRGSENSRASADRTDVSPLGSAATEAASVHTIGRTTAVASMARRKRTASRPGARATG